MCGQNNCGCNTPNNPIICVSYQPNESCEDRVLTTSNTTDSQGYSGVTIITPEVNQISAFKEHLEFVNSTEPLSGIKKHTVLRFAQNFINSITNIFRGRNVGTLGAEIYKGSTTVGSNTYQDFRKIAGSPSIVVDQIGDNIVPSIDEDWLEEQLPDVPLTSLNSVGAGEDLYTGQTGTVANISTLNEGDGIMFTRESDGSLTVSAPQAPDDTIKQFYVNQNYTGGGSSFLGNGSILKPYKRLIYALDAAIGTGTLINPQYRDSEVILQSNVTITTLDLSVYTRLENRLSINTVKIKSDNNYTINYNGTQEEILSTEFLKTKALSTSGFTGELYISLDKITVRSTTIKRIVNFEVFQNSSISTTHYINDLTIAGLYNIESYISFSPPVDYFGNDLKYQAGSIANTSSTVYLHGFNSNGAGSYNFTGYFKVIGTSQTFLKVENTSVNIEKLFLETQSEFVSIDNTTNRNPRAGLDRVEVHNAFLSTSLEIDGTNHPTIGGQDSLIRYFDDGSYAGAGLTINGGYIYFGRFNKLISINSVDKSLFIQNCDFRGGNTITTALYNENGVSPIRNISADNTYINNVDSSTSCGVKVNATLAFINGYEYSNPVGFVNDTAALAAGLISGNIYFNTTTEIPKRLP